MTDGSTAHERIVSSATAVAAPSRDGWRAVLIFGRSGAGKSALALQMIAFGAKLIADDVVRLRARGNELYASALRDNDGRIESRGFGILKLPQLQSAPTLFGVELSNNRDERLPKPRRQTLLSIALPFIDTSYSEALAASLFCVLRDGDLIDPEARSGFASALGGSR